MLLLIDRNGDGLLNQLHRLVPATNQREPPRRRSASTGLSTTASRQVNDYSQANTLCQTTDELAVGSDCDGGEHDLHFLVNCCVELQWHFLAQLTAHLDNRRVELEPDW